MRDSFKAKKLGESLSPPGKNRRNLATSIEKSIKPRSHEEMMKKSLEKKGFQKRRQKFESMPHVYPTPNYQSMYPGFDFNKQYESSDDDGQSDSTNNDD